MSSYVSKWNITNILPIKIWYTVLGSTAELIEQRLFATWVHITFAVSSPRSPISACSSCFSIHHDVVVAMKLMYWKQGLTFGAEVYVLALELARVCVKKNRSVHHINEGFFTSPSLWRYLIFKWISYTLRDAYIYYIVVK